MDIRVIVGSTSMLLKKNSRMMLRLPEADAEIVKQYSESETRSFNDQLLHFIRLGIKSAQVNGTESKPGPQRAEISSKERKQCG